MYKRQREAFMERFKEHGFVIDTIAKFNEETQALDEIIGRLQDLQKLSLIHI